VSFIKSDIIETAHGSTCARARLDPSLMLHREMRHDTSRVSLAATGTGTTYLCLFQR